MRGVENTKITTEIMNRVLTPHGRDGGSMADKDICLFCGRDLTEVEAMHSRKFCPEHRDTCEECYERPCTCLLLLNLWRRKNLGPK